jgi:multiple sugar transport system ATP-binding protein
MARIALQGLTKRYEDGTEAVKALDLEVADGELMIFVGPSGCGKTTALRMVAGLEDITAGTLLIGDREVNHLPPRDRDIAMVFQNYALYPHMTVRENMGFALRLGGVDKAERNRRVERTAAILDLTEHLDRKPGKLSGGQRQRVAMGRAIVREPQAFLMDEPLSNLDAKLRVQMRAEVTRLQARLGTTTIYVTHDQTEAMTLGDRVAVMRDGVLQQVDTPKALYQDPANVFVAGFIGSPQMNLVPAALEDGQLRLPFADVPLPVRLADPGDRGVESRGVMAGLRPEAFEDAALAGADAVGRRFRVRPEVVEAMGSEVFVHFAVPGGGRDELVVARLGAESSAAVGAEMELLVRSDNVCLFDPRSGERLGRAGAVIDAVGA